MGAGWVSERGSALPRGHMVFWIALTATVLAIKIGFWPSIRFPYSILAIPRSLSHLCSIVFDAQ